jgi:hypothetical protein
MIFQKTLLGELNTAFIVFLVCLTAACSQTSVTLPRESAAFFEEYKKKPHFRAIATTGEQIGRTGGGYSTGRSWGHINARLAIEDAMESCERARKEKVIAPRCRLYAIGDILVSGMTQQQLAREIGLYEDQYYLWAE